MDNLARHMRISSVAVSDNDVESRSAAAKSLATLWRKVDDPDRIVSLAADIAGALSGNGVPSSELGERVQMSIQKKAPSFLYDERPLDVGICSGMAMVSILNGAIDNDGWTVLDVYATALWSALSYQPALPDERRENLRLEVLEKALNFYAASTEKVRERIDVPKPSKVDITVAEDVVTNNFSEAITGTIEALRRNAALDREELDFLWWVQLGHSRLLKKQLSKIDEPVRIVTAGIEAAQILRRLPCEVHREIVLRTLDRNPELDLEELLSVIGDDRTTLSAGLMAKHILAHPTVFPLLYALTTGEIDQINSSIKRSISEWGERALLEATFAKMMSQGAGTI
ncbi:GTPase-associated system all-helical protein GASH [Serratia marcescens]|uniref:GTPase-associated system all-helical protein GASH n=1 Tax=Serratia marcescens TaxID=615 RepID=UPI0027621967|nr:GTPase-associated system all-helical protein GASH [Serratia marcescens]MDP8601647.1 GTPase-associated system all-helical protein GASH [Serratia marcescens]MDP8686347.1 GTPase-associated system all-helical protein GASH [Serratia marcescens]MDP8735969.1 GTPase-associated system all-helical protein GASH [Serratia marcescens]MDP8795245.1 GTPase-associated system all-helical protein GASH [Serratia marcescens]HEJ7836451.1 hypothetical protein [Serratia marcescens]